jgi:hypothetical protein
MQPWGNDIRRAIVSRLRDTDLLDGLLCLEVGRDRGRFGRSFITARAEKAVIGDVIGQRE